HKGIYFLLLLASVGTFLHTGLKLPYFTWLGKANGPATTKRALLKNMYVGIFIGGSLCVFFGLAPQVLYNWLPYNTDFRPYNLYHLVESCQILLFTFIAFMLLRKKLAGENKGVVDTDFLYRRPAPAFQRVTVDSVNSFFGFAEKGFKKIVAGVATLGVNPLAYIPFSGEQKGEFNPDVSRPPLARGICVFILVFVALALWAF
ncbi:MAG: hypothetical protein WEB87_01265, partial [Bacteriovoracaceae bacterium]